MCKVQMLRALVEQRLTAAAEEIFGLFERTIAEYEKELSASRDENERQRRLLDAVFNPQLRLHRAGLLVKEEVPSEQQDWRSNLDQEDPEPPHIIQDPEAPHIKEDEEDLEPLHIKEEQKELWTSQEGEQLQGLEEAGIKFSFTPVKSEHDDDEEEEEAASSQLHQRLTEHMDTEADGEDCGGPEPDRKSDPERHPHSSDSDKASQCYRQAIKVSEDRNETREPQSGLNFTQNNEYNSSEKQFHCSECGKRFNQNSNLKTHMRTHTGEKPFSCSVCGKKFGQKAHLQNHLKCHTGEKPYSCSFCNKCFARAEHLQLHMRTHTGEKPFSCNVCAKRFTWLGQFKSHKCRGESAQFQELWAGRAGEEFHAARFPFPPAPLKSEDDDEESPKSSQLHQRHREDCGGPGAARNADPDSLETHGLPYNAFIGQFW
ncbi:zinc finger protein 135-like [Clinocottus analis]|uniref:zinc finger protein 135-like n=1 Tax=Clinocottus analis TaxID=304258 RepID=UPI0035C2326D